MMSVFQKDRLPTLFYKDNCGMLPIVLTTPTTISTIMPTIQLIKRLQFLSRNQLSLLRIGNLYLHTFVSEKIDIITFPMLTLWEIQG